MKILSLCWLIIVGVVGLFGILFGYRRVRSIWVSAGYFYYALKKRLLSGVGLWEKEEEYYREIFVNQEPERMLRKQLCMEGLGILGLLGFMGLILLFFSVGGQFLPSEVKELLRPETGTGTRELLAEYNGEMYPVSVSLTEKQMTAEEIRELWAQNKSELPRMILGENASLERVSSNLFLPDHLPHTPVKITWYSSNYRLVSYDGTVNREYMSGAEEKVFLTARLVYGDWEAEESIPVTIVRASKSTEEAKELVSDAIRDRVGAQNYEDKVTLPNVVAGKEVHFYHPAEQTPWTIPVLSVVGMVGILAAARENRKKKKELRQAQLYRDYPEVVSKMTLLMEAGMTIRGAWERVVSDYEKYGRRERRYAYEEMLRTSNLMQVGTPEDKAYGEFGRRCGSILYLRFSSVLVQNLRKGTGSILPLLKKEAEEALFERKEQARKLGEEAGTKLLLPMAGMLVLVLVIVMIPAFMSF